MSLRSVPGSVLPQQCYADGAGYGIAHLDGSEAAHRCADHGPQGALLVRSDGPVAAFRQARQIALHGYAARSPNIGIRPDRSGDSADTLGRISRGPAVWRATLNVTGSIDFNQRDVAIVQARSGGFVVRVYARAPGDVIGAGAPIADLQLPEWGGAQTEFLAVRRLGRADLTAAARQRLKLMGMSDGADRRGRADRPHQWHGDDHLAHRRA
jgi:hypothetical protein